MIMLTLACMLCFGSSLTVCAAEKTDSTAVVLENESTPYNTKVTKKQMAAIKELFNAKEYADMYPDVVKALGTSEEALWNHFVTYGFSEGRSLSKDFNVFAYASSYPDLQVAFGDDLASYYMHYINFGKAEKRPLITIEKAEKAGVVVYGVKGVAIGKNTPVTEKDKASAKTYRRPSEVMTKKSSTTTTTTSTKTTTKENTSEDKKKPTKPSNPTVVKPEPTPDIPHEHTYVVKYITNKDGVDYHAYVCTEDGVVKPSAVAEDNGLIECSYKAISVGENKHNYVCTECKHVKTISGTETTEACVDEDGDGKCDECDAEIKTPETPDPEECKHENVTYTVNSNGTHTKHCKDCDKDIEEASAHNWEIVQCPENEEEQDNSGKYKHEWICTECRTKDETRGSESCDFDDVSHTCKICGRVVENTSSGTESGGQESTDDKNPDSSDGGTKDNVNKDGASGSVTENPDSSASSGTTSGSDSGTQGTDASPTENQTLENSGK